MKSCGRSPAICPPCTVGATAHCCSLAAGLTKHDIQEKLWSQARLPSDHFAADFAAMEQAAGRGGEGMLWRTQGPERIHVVVAGGAGPQDVYMAAGLPQTRLIRG
jgi:hypothetical protein